jgi:hypothetical protein
MRKLFLLAAAVLLVSTACSGTFVDPGMMDALGNDSTGGGGSTKEEKSPGGDKNALVGKWVNGSYYVEFTKTQFRCTDTADMWLNYRLTGKKIEYNFPSYGWFTWCESYTIDGNTIEFTGGESRSGKYKKQ